MNLKEKCIRLQKTDIGQTPKGMDRLEELEAPAAGREQPHLYTLR